MVFMACKGGPGRPSHKRYGAPTFNMTDKRPDKRSRDEEDDDGNDEVAPKRGRGVRGGRRGVRGRGGISL